MLDEDTNWLPVEALQGGEGTESKGHDGLGLIPTELSSRMPGGELQSFGPRQGIWEGGSSASPPAGAPPPHRRSSHQNYPGSFRSEGKAPCRVRERTGDLSLYMYVVLLCFNETQRGRHDSRLVVVHVQSFLGIGIPRGSLPHHTDSWVSHSV